MAGNQTRKKKKSLRNGKRLQLKTLVSSFGITSWFLNSNSWKITWLCHHSSQENNVTSHETQVNTFCLVERCCCSWSAFLFPEENVTVFNDNVSDHKGRYQQQSFKANVTLWEAPICALATSRLLPLLLSCEIIKMASRRSVALLNVLITRSWIKLPFSVAKRRLNYAAQSARPQLCQQWVLGPCWGFSFILRNEGRAGLWLTHTHTHSQNTIYQNTVACLHQEEGKLRGGEVEERWGTEPDGTRRPFCSSGYCTQTLWEVVHWYAARSQPNCPSAYRPH